MLFLSVRINIPRLGRGIFIYFVVLCAYANFRTSYKRIDGISYTIYPGEWIMSVEELSRYFRTRFRRQTLAALEGLQKKGLISFLVLGHGKLVKFKIRGGRTMKKTAQEPKVTENPLYHDKPALTDR